MGSQMKACAIYSIRFTGMNCVLNAEAPFLGAQIGTNRDLNRYEYDSLIRVLATLPHRDLQWYVDASIHSLLDELLDDLGETSRKFFVFCNVPQQWHHELGLCVVLLARVQHNLLWAQICQLSCRSIQMEKNCITVTVLQPISSSSLYPFN